MPTEFKLYMINLKLLMEYGAQTITKLFFCTYCGYESVIFAMLICA